MSERVILEPGEHVPTSGQYVQIAGNGRVMNDGAEATLVKGEPAPPTDKSGWRWRMVDATRHADAEAGQVRAPARTMKRQQIEAPAGPYVSAKR